MLFLAATGSSAISPDLVELFRKMASVTCVSCDVGERYGSIKPLIVRIKRSLFRHNYAVELLLVSIRWFAITVYVYKINNGKFL